MIIRRSRRYTVKMADFETYSFGADVEMSHHDMGLSDDDVTKLSDEDYEATKKDLTEHVLGELNNQLHDEIYDAAELTTNQKSFLLKAFGIKKTTTKRRI